MKILIQKTPTSDWDSFIQKYADDGGLLQSSLWGGFQKKLGRIPHYITVYKDNDVLLQCLCVASSLKVAAYTNIFIPRGPVLHEKAQTSEIVLSFFLKHITIFAKNKRAAFIRMEPPYTTDKSLLEKTLLHNGYKKTVSIEPQNTLIIPLETGADVQKKKLHPKTRYNIKLAQKKGVVVHNTTHPTEKQLDSFHHLLTQTQQRQQFGIYSAPYFKKLFDACAESEKIRLFWAERNGKEIASAIIAYWNNWAYYLYGGSDYAERNNMAPHLLHWTIMQDAAEKKNEKYDMWGVQNPKKQSGKEKTWAGITRFKKGFSPETKTAEYLGTYEKITAPIFGNIYKSAQKIRSFF